MQVCEGVAEIPHHSNAYDKWSELEHREDWEFERELMGNREVVSLKKHKRFMNFMREENEELEKELENIKEGKGYISQASHDEAMQEQLHEQQGIIRETSRKLGVANNRASLYEDRYNLMETKMDAQRAYYEEQIQKIGAKD